MIKRIFFLSSIFLTSLFSLDFKVASYNVENLFDLKYDGTEYDEYKPNSKYWDKKAFNAKLNNIVQVVNELDADIISLQEIESQEALDELTKKINYKYTKFIKNKNSSIGVAILSKFPIIKNERIIVDKYDKYSRDILKSIINIENKEFIVYTNHWRSKRAPESFRIKYSTALKNDYEKLQNDVDYIILGDLNSNYNEFQTFKYDKKLNNTYGITGINQVLNTTLDGNFIRKDKIFEYDKNIHYNLWLDLKQQDRFSTKFKTQLNTPDNIIVPKALFDNYNISYIQKSFSIFKPNYLYKNDYIQRWNKNQKSGYSDHLPIYAMFSTDNQNIKFSDTKKKVLKNSIESLYLINTIVKPVDLNSVVVIYKSDDIAIIKQTVNGKAIMIYKPPTDLKLGFRYDIVVHKIDYYNGLKEIKELSISNKLKYDSSYEKFITDINSIDIFNEKNQNQVVKNINGIYKKGYLYFIKNSNEYKIKLYFRKDIKRPDDNDDIFIKRGQITIYKSKIQITINQQNDFE